MQRILSAWAWVAAVSTVIFGFLYVSAVWLVTAPFDRGRYQAGRAFRQLAVTAVSLNPLWHFETATRRPIRAIRTSPSPTTSRTRTSSSSAIFRGR